MAHSRFRNAAARGIIMAVLAAAATALLASCIEDGFPEISQVNISPSTLDKNDTTGMNDQTFDIELVVDGFEGAITDADVFIQLQSHDQYAAKDDFDPQGDTIEIIGVAYTWFGNLEAGAYKVGAEVTTDAGETSKQLDLATVRIVQ